MFKIASLIDVDFIYSLETDLFSEDVRSSKSSIVRSIKSSNQTVMILEDESKQVGVFILMHYEKTNRIYSIAVGKAHQGMGYGKKMMNYIFDLSDKENKSLILEVEQSNSALVKFYHSFGFVSNQVLPDYYGIGKNGIKMSRSIDFTTKQFKNLIVVDKAVPWLKNIPEIEIISTDEYISNEIYSNFKGRVFNLCDSYKYQSSGYYVSLLAVARETQVIPNVITIKDFKNKAVLKSLTDEIDEIIQEDLQNIKYDKFTMKIYFGMIKSRQLKRVAKELYNLFETPFLEIEFEKYEKWSIKKATPFSIRKITHDDYDFVNSIAGKYFSSSRIAKKKLKNYIYDLAILVNNEEKWTAPSNSKALALFKKAAEEIGFFVEFITKKDFHKLSEYDALFIRETTNVNDHTYDFARYAYSEGLVVIDDPWSILKCSNKIYLYEKLRKNNIAMPSTIVLNQHQFNSNSHKDLVFPIILKRPDSAFSKGVFKVTNHKMFVEKVKELFKTSQMVLAQEYIESDFDWRIGILNNVPIFACKYFMSYGHWQIYNWEDVNDEGGDVTSYEIKDVPEKVLKAALKSAALIGKGLYGVDLKEKGDKVYIIEINDNPSIDFGIEDQIAGYKLYQDIVNYLFVSIDKERNVIRYVSQSK